MNARSAKHGLAGSDLPALAAAALLVVTLYFWAASGNREFYRGRPVTYNHYNLLVDGFLSGHLYMDPAPGPGPQAQGDGLYRTWLHDTSLYRGHYYLYFGIAPAALLFLPWKVVSGGHLAQYWAGAVFASLGYLASLALLGRVKRDFFPWLSSKILFGSALLLGLINWWPVLLSRVGTWEVSIASASCFSALALLCLYEGTRQGGRAGWLAAASLSYGLTVASRPNYILGVAVLALPFLYFWRTEGASPAGMARWRSRIFALGLPILGIGVLLAAYNYARFGNPLEFGTRYMILLVPAPERTFSASFAWTNLYMYFLAPAHLSAWFPFFRLSRLPPLPPGYSADPEEMYGMLANMPVLLLGPAAIWIAGIRGGISRLSVAVGSLALLLLAVGGMLMLYCGANGRYTVDAMAGLPVLAVLGIWAIESRVRTAGLRRTAARIAWGALACYSALFASCAFIGRDEIFRTVHPVAYRALAHALDMPPLVYDRATGFSYGPLTLSVTFPSDRALQSQPLVVTGWGPLSNVIFVRYADASHVQFGFGGAGGTFVGAPIAADYSRSHVLKVSMGSLYPPRESPFFDSLERRDADTLSRTLLIELDGAMILHQPAYFHDADARRPMLGRGPSVLGREWVFTGKLSEVR